MGVKLKLCKSMDFHNPKSLKYTQNIDNDCQLHLEELSDELAYNYLANSFGDDVFNHTNYKDILRNSPSNNQISEEKNLGEIYNKRKIDRRRCRNILIIGAGASFDSYSGVPLGQQLVNSFEDIFVSKIKSIPFLQEKFELEKKEIHKLLKGDFDFENFLSLLSNHFVSQSTLRSEIKNHTGFRFSPSLFYEIVAHMLKHTFLDVVINFNFDELLDQCILEELGEENYHFVLSDGHTVKIEDILVEGRIKAPVYIKPHGTFSHKSSLRFTKRHYLDLPYDVKEMLQGLLSGYRGGGKEVERVNLICVGFDLASIEFNDILNESLPSSSRIYHFFYNDKDSPETINNAMRAKIESQLGIFLNKAVSNGQSFQDIYKPINIKGFNKEQVKNELTSPLAELFSLLWRITYNRFNIYNKPRSIARHEIISYLFYDKELFTNFGKNSEDRLDPHALRHKMREYFEESPKYYRDRVMIEVAIDLLRNNGNVDIVEILKGRTGMFFEKYVETSKTFSNKIRLKHSIYDFLSEFSKEGAANENIYEEKNYPSTKLTFRILPFSRDELDKKVIGDIKIKFQNDIVNNFKKPIDKFFAPKATEDGKKSIEKRAIDKIVNDETNEFISWIRTAVDLYYLENPLGVSILCNFLRSDFLSSKVRENLLNNYKKKVYNGLLWQNKGLIETKVVNNVEKQPSNQTSTKSNNKLQELETSEIIDENEKSNLSMIQELFRIFSKTSASNYFNIRAKKSDSRYRIWESFQLKNVLHTNLLLVNDFKYVFLKKNWDCLLSVFETGDTIKYIIKENVHNEDFLVSLQNKTIVLLCSYEAVEQTHLLKTTEFRERYDNDSFYKNVFDVNGILTNQRSRNERDKLSDSEKYKIELLIEKHKELLCSEIKVPEQQTFTKEVFESMNEKERKEYEAKLDRYAKYKENIKKGISLVLVPFWEHNQHCSIFLKSVDANNEILNNSEEGLMLIKPRKIDTKTKVQEKNSEEIIRDENNIEKPLKKSDKQPVIFESTGKDDALSKIALENIPNYAYLFEGGYHMYRKGFSNNLNPVRIGNKDITIDDKYIKRDIDKLLLFYFNVLCRGIMYQVQNASQMGYDDEFIIRDLVYHRAWSADEFFNRMQLFMGQLFGYVRKRYVD